MPQVAIRVPITHIKRLYAIVDRLCGCGTNISVFTESILKVLNIIGPLITVVLLVLTLATELTGTQTKPQVLALAGVGLFIVCMHTRIEAKLRHRKHA